MRVLLDTCAISEMRKQRVNSGVRKTVSGWTHEQMFLSVVSLGELVKGVALLEGGRRKEELQDWLNRLETEYTDRLLAIDAETTRIWGELTASAQRKGYILGAADGLIAATAHRHGLYLMTRNIRDFENTGVRILNPWT